MRTRSLCLLLILCAVPLCADDVYLTNGRKFEGVVAETIGSQVRIQMQGGVLSLPKGQVLRVETAESSLAEYLRRKEALKKGGSAADWLSLAEWTRGKGLEQASREAALAAAAENPRLEGLAPVLRGYGYVLDEQLGRWILFEESMRRKGFVQANGQWITREEYAARARGRDEELARYRAARQEEARAAREDRLAALAELSIVRDLSQASYPPAYPVSPFYGAQVVVIPGFWVTPKTPMKRDPSAFTHVPGSLIPGNLFPESP